jgi:predicted XRE-type DNA-binding protein
MTNNADFDGPNWRENPLENTPPVKRGDNFLASRGHKDPEAASLKFQIADKIRLAVDSKQLSQAKFVAVVNRHEMNTTFAQPDASRILNGNVGRYSMERLLGVLVALGTRVTIRAEPVEPGQGCLIMAQPHHENA